MTAKATCNGNITATGGATPTVRGFEWGLIQGGPYGNSWTENGSFGTGAFSHEFTGLAENTLHYYRAKAYNSAGWGYGGEQSFTTWKRTSTTDSGSGTEATPNEAQISIADVNASAVDSPRLEGQIPPTDSGAGVDAPDLAVTFVATDDGVGLEATSSEITFTVADAGVGSETVSPEIEFTVTDAGAGSEWLEVVPWGTINVYDAGAGVDACDLEADVTVSETGSGDDVWSGEFTIPATDSGEGIESVTAETTFTIVDAAVGSDAITLEGQVSSVDSGAGTEATNVEISFLIGDSGQGVDVWSASYSIPVSDAGTGADVWGLEYAATITDAGLGSEYTIINATLHIITDSGVGVDTVVSISFTITDVGAGVDLWGLAANLSLADSGTGSESISLSITLTATDAGSGIDAWTLQGQVTVLDSGALLIEYWQRSYTYYFGVVDSALGVEFAWRIKPSSPMVDDLALPHVLSIRISDPAAMSDKKVQGGSLPRRTMMGKPGRIVEVEGWSDSQAEIDALEALCDGVRRTFYHPNGDSFGVLVTGFQPSRTVDQHNRRTYRLALAEAN